MARSFQANHYTVDKDDNTLVKKKNGFSIFFFIFFFIFFSIFLSFFSIFFWKKRKKKRSLPCSKKKNDKKTVSEKPEKCGPEKNEKKNGKIIKKKLTFSK